MRYLRGGSLHDYIKKQGKLNIEEAFNMLAQISQGLHVAHRNQVVHRDIKPGNILLDEDSNAYLGDFGIAKDYTASQSLTEPDSLIGSPEYLAPEQARSEPVTPQTDIYSLGVVLYEMLAGEHPFPGVDKITYIFKHLNDPLPEISTLDASIRDDVNDVIQKATEKDPKQRFQDVIAMMEALRRAAQLDTAPTPTSVVELLTPREQEVMQLIIDGKTNREIADVLVLAEATVKSYIKNIYRKLNVRSRVQAIARARDLDFVIKKPEIPRTTGHLPEPQNPYKGLSAFQAADAGVSSGVKNSFKNSSTACRKPSHTSVFWRWWGRLVAASQAWSRRVSFRLCGVATFPVRKTGTSSTFCPAHIRLMNSKWRSSRLPPTKR